MSEKARIFILRITALAAVFIFLYPPVLAARASLFKTDGGLYGFALAVLFGAAGFLMGEISRKSSYEFIDRLLSNPVWSYFVNKNTAKAAAEKIIVYSTMFIPVIAAYIIYRAESSFRVALEMAAAFVFYFNGLRSGFLPFNEILHHKKMIVGAFLIVISLGVSYYYKGCLYLKPVILGFGYAFTMICLLVKNQDSLDYYISINKGVDKAGVPKNVRSYNIVITTILFVSIILLFNLKSIVIFMLGIAGEVIRFILWLFYKLMSLVAPGAGNSGMGQPPGSMAPFSGKQANPLYNLIYNIVGNFIFLYIIYRALLAFTGNIKSLIARFIGYLRKHFNRLFLLKDETGNDYTDEIEVLKPEDMDIDGGKVRKKLRNMKKDLKGITDPVEKIRYLYGITLGMLIGKGIDIRKSNTTGEIYAKSLRIKGIENYFSKITVTYDSVRYGDKIPDSLEVSDIEGSYSKTIEMLKKQ